MKRRIAARAIIEKDGKLLLAKLAGYGSHDGVPNDFWCTFGGGVDEMESLEDAIIREMIEETGITPVVGPLLFVQQYEMNDVESIEFFFHVTNTEDYINIDLSKTTHGQKEIAEISFVDPKEENILPAFLKEIDYSTIANAQTKFFNYL
jgi:8-oxo-dGTP pyrophosphatase MutT (NUDIX family)